MRQRLATLQAAHSRRAPQTTMAQQHTEEHTYHPQDAIGVAFKATALTGGFGLFASAVQNTLAKQNVGPLGIFLRSGGTIAIFGTVYPQYVHTRLRRKNLELTVGPCVGDSGDGRYIFIRANSVR